MTALRVGLVGARRARQGIGPYVARDLRAAGAELPCFLATSEASRDAGAADLARELGIRARGYLDWDAMVAAERLDAVAICSPHETHTRYLDAALAAGLHALCEKPLVWDAPDLGAAAAQRVRGFAARGLRLVENCQWTYTLDAFERLHPGVLAAPPRRFAMHLEPAGRGEGMLADTLPHVLSLLQRLAPDPAPRLEAVRFAPAQRDSEHLEVAFVYRAGAAAVEARADLLRTERRPRCFWLEIDGQRAERRVTLPGYGLVWCDGERREPLADPLTRLVADFVHGAASGGPAPPAEESAVRMRLLDALRCRYREAVAAAGPAQ